MIALLEWIAASWRHVFIALCLVALFRPVRCSVKIDRRDD